jgi:hypothetical protein
LDVYWLIESEQLIQGRRKNDPAFRGFSTASCSRSVLNVRQMAYSELGYVLNSPLCLPLTFTYE